MRLLDRIERHLKESHMSATRFGRRAVGDPRFVLDLRAGRRPRRRTVEKVENYLARHSRGCSQLLLTSEQKENKGHTCNP
jgi:2,4-dienoyl-CoA reductase-like NADH-dependent reductase (Old Yellow Enzyme family)